MKIELSYTTSFRVNAPRGWRQKVAQVLVTLAKKVDRKRWLLAVDFSATHPVGNATEREIVLMGTSLMRELFEDAAGIEALECLMRSRLPELYRTHVGDLKC